MSDKVIEIKEPAEYLNKLTYNELKRLVKATGMKVVFDKRQPFILLGHKIKKGS